MRLSGTVPRKCKYALRAIFELALRNTPDPVKIQDIAFAQAIPQRFLEIILAELKHAGFVESRRGNEGGYILARPADRLTVGEVITFLEGRPTHRPEAVQQPPKRLGDYVFASMWKQVSTAICRVYNQTTFADLVEQELANRSPSVADYVI
jgi:Rrf2 family protein